MDNKDKLSLILFILFICSYTLKLIILYKKNNIKASVLARGTKETKIKRTELFVKITTFSWGATWLFLSIFNNLFKNHLIQLFNNSLISFIGLAITCIGLIIFIVSMISMKSSWRVGIDKETKSTLVTNGIYKLSRNPAFVGFDLMFLGLFLSYPNLLTLIILILNLASIHLLILQEEKHLRTMFKDDYLNYSAKTPRYILIK
ncbi:MAG: isoprenylcysteine carboxylmethyltransferase family protein [Clostridiaceae bacterium]